MHECGSGSALLVNAEVDSMGGVVDGGAGIGIKTSPCRAAIEKAQAELRQEYDFREEKRRELEFLEKGGNPLDFKIGNAASVSVQSTSLTDHHAEHFVTSEAKGSFALTASPRGDSVESSGRPEARTVCEPNSADNFDGENELLEGERNAKHPSKRNKVAPPEHSSQMDATQHAKESDDSAIVRPYARRNRSRPNRDGARSSSTDVVSGGHGSSLPFHGGSKNAKGPVFETSSQKDCAIPSVSNPRSTVPNGGIVSQMGMSNIQSKMEPDGAQALEVITDPPENRSSADKLDVIELNILSTNQHNHTSEVDTQRTLVDVASREDHVERKGHEDSADLENPPCAATKKSENGAISAQKNACNDSQKDGNEGQNGNAAITTKGLVSESSCTKKILSLDENVDSDLCIKHRNNYTNGTLMKQKSEPEGTKTLVADEMKNEENKTKAIDSCATINDDHNSVCENHTGNDSTVKTVEEMQRSFDLPKEVKCPNNEGVEQGDFAAAEFDKKVDNMLCDERNSNGENSVGPQSSVNLSVPKLPGSTEKNSSVAFNLQSSSIGQLKMLDKAREDSILAEARIIEAKHKRIAELSVAIVPLESRRKSHWDFVLEEMAWLANDFAQERLWKITTAAQICRRAAFTSRLRLEGKNEQWKLKKVAYTLAKAVMHFWHSAEALANNNDESPGLKNCKHDLTRFDGSKSSDDKFGESVKDACNELQNPPKNLPHAIQRYALRFLKRNNCPVPSLEAEAPPTPDQIADPGIVEVSWDNQLTEESLFYAVPLGAMETYRTSIESHLAQFEKTGSSMQEEVDTSTYDAAAEFGYHENACDEEEGETSTYYLLGVFDGSKSIKHDQKKRKTSMKSFSGRSYDVGADLAYGHSISGSQPTLMGKRPANNLNVGFQTKRVRTASRQRIVSPFIAGANGGLQTSARTDASSGDTSSLQDDQSTLHGGTQMQRSMEVESVGDFEKLLPYDCTDTSTKPKKKKKAKYLGSAYERGWQLGSALHNEQRENSKRRLESHHFDPDGTSGLHGQHTAKKPKIIKQLLDTNFDNFGQMAGSVPSPAASQMSNMSNTNRIMRLISGRDRGRKPKSLKMLTGQPGSGSPWSDFEDQALVVLVHDMGPNWELISDAINSTLQFKCIYRKPKECKERHKILMDKSAGDGADSAEDSGSSQSYPSTLPGIPKGSARQLFQRLQGPMEEDTLKCHFEKIIMIGKKQLYRRSQEPKPITAVHDSHFIALSKVCPNNINGGVLTPLDLCDVTGSNPDVLPLGHQGSHASGLAMPNQGAAASILPSSCANSSLQGSSSMVLGNNSSSLSGPLSAPLRDGRHNVPRSSLPVDEQQRMQHYNQMLSGRNLQHPNLPVSGADRRMLPVGNGVGMMPGMNRSIPLARPGFQGVASSSMLNSGSVHSSSMVGMPSPVNMHSGTVSSQGNSMMRPREALHMLRPGHNPEHQRQMMVPELQMQVTQGNSQGIPVLNGLSSAFANQTSHAPVPTYQGHPQQQHPMSPQQSHVLNNHHPNLQGPNHGSQQQAHSIHIERHMQQRLLQQQQQFGASSAMMPHVQPQAQLPMATSLQNSSQIQPQPSSQSAVSPLSPSSPMTPLSMQQQKHNLPLHRLNSNPQAASSGVTNHMGKQRQRQPQPQQLQQQQQQQNFQQSGRHHPQQRQHPQSPQQSKLMKGMGRGNMVAHQNVPIDHSHLNGLSVPSGNQGAGKGEQLMHLMQGQGLCSGHGLAPIQPTKSLVPQSSNHSQPQQKIFTGSTPASSKQSQQTPSHSDNSVQGQVAPVPSGHALSASHPAVSAGIMHSTHQHLQSQSQPHQKLLGQAQSTVQRMIQQNCQVSSDLTTKSHIDQGHTDQQPVNNVSRMSTSTTTAMPPVCNDSANVMKPSESLFDSGMPNRASQVVSVGTLPLTDTAGNDPVPSVSQGLVQRQSSGGLPQLGHNVGAQWQEQSQLPQSTTAALSSQQLFQLQEQRLQQEQQSSQQQRPSQQQSQRLAQNLQPAQSSLYIRSTTSKLE